MPLKFPDELDFLVIQTIMRFVAFLSFVGHVAALWPAPQSFTNGSSTVWIAEDFQVSYNQQDVG